MLSCCCRSRQTSVLRRLGSVVVPVSSYCEYVANCFSVFLTAFPRSQSLGSSASTFGAWPIFMYWTLLKPTFLAQLTAGTSNTDGSWSVSDPLSPSSIGAYCICAENGPGTSSCCGCWRCGRSTSQKGSTVYCLFPLSCGWKP